MAPGEMKNVPGAAAAQMEAEFVLDIVLEAGRLCDRIITFLGKRAKGWPPKPMPKMEFPKRFEKRVESIWRALWACGMYQSGTILLYTHVIGKLVQWADELSITRLDRQGVEQFLHYYVQQRRPRGTEKLCKQSGDGLGVRYVAFYAIKAVLDSLCGLDLTNGMRPPPHPSPVDPASTAACCALHAEANSDREQLLLLLTNGVGLRPSETAALGWNDFHPGFSDVTVQRRGKSVSLEIPGHVAPALAECRLRCLEHTYVFQSCRGVSPVPVGVRSLQYVLARLVKRCDLEERVTLTTLRKAAVYHPGMTPGERPRGKSSGESRDPIEMPQREDISALSVDRVQSLWDCPFMATARSECHGSCCDMTAVGLGDVTPASTTETSCAGLQGGDTLSARKWSGWATVNDVESHQGSACSVMLVAVTPEHTCTDLSSTSGGKGHGGSTQGATFGLPVCRGSDRLAA